MLGHVPPILLSQILTLIVVFALGVSASTAHAQPGAPSGSDDYMALASFEPCPPQVGKGIRIHIDGESSNRRDAAARIRGFGCMIEGAAVRYGAGKATRAGSISWYLREEAEMPAGSVPNSVTDKLHAVFVTYRFLDSVNDDALLFTLAHEVGHIVLDHVAKERAEKKKWPDECVRSNLSFTNELHADRYAFELLQHQMGFSAERAIQAVRSLLHVLPNDYRPRPCKFGGRQYPTNEQRISALLDHPLTENMARSGTGNLETSHIQNCPAKVEFRDAGQWFQLAQQAAKACGNPQFLPRGGEFAYWCPSASVPGPYCGSYFADEVLAKKNCDSPEFTPKGTGFLYYCPARKLVTNRWTYYAFERDAMRDCKRPELYKFSMYRCPIK
jgi:hypothetical protein